MRMRKKKNLVPRLESAKDLFVPSPENYIGNWSCGLFGGKPVYLEIGCGKGSFISALSLLNPKSAYIGLERVPEAVVMAAEKVMLNGNVNTKFIIGDADELLAYFSPGEITGIYINFPDPWPKSRHEKRRLTSKAYLDRYFTILKPGSELCLRTDNLPLFDFSLETIGGSQFEIVDVSTDLHPNGDDGSVMTDYERKFVSMGVKINMLKAVRR